MNCCSNCFSEKELINNITQTAESRSQCDYCNATGALVVDVRTLSELFRPILALYKEDKQSNNNIASLLQKKWAIFNVDTRTATRLLIDMFSDETSIPNDLFSTGVSNVAEDHEKTKQHLHIWESLKTEIITKNRFFLDNAIDLDVLEKFLKYKSHRYKQGTVFYRGRLAEDKQGLHCSEMGKPPADKATAGRANPQGIPYLYLSRDKTTALHESRVTHLDFVTIGAFELSEAAEIIKLRALKIESPFEEELFEKLLYHPFLECLENDLAKPLRRFESDLNYLPTQYICEFVKKLGYDGIEYGSAMKEGGINLAFFDDSKLTCVETSVIEVSNINIEYNNLDQARIIPSRT